MGVMIDGRWTSDEEASKLKFKDGAFERRERATCTWGRGRRPPCA
jgi:hypothetical protein